MTNARPEAAAMDRMKLMLGLVQQVEVNLADYTVISAHNKMIWTHKKCHKVTTNKEKKKNILKCLKLIIFFYIIYLSNLFFMPLTNTLTFEQMKSLE